MLTKYLNFLFLARANQEHCLNPIYSNFDKRLSKVKHLPQPCQPQNKRKSPPPNEKDNTESVIEPESKKKNSEENDEREVGLQTDEGKFVKYALIVSIGFQSFV